jgi:hypothetical protein
MDFSTISIKLFYQINATYTKLICRIIVSGVLETTNKYKIFCTPVTVLKTGEKAFLELI